MLSAEAGIVVMAAAVIFAAALISSIAGFAFSALAGAALVQLLQDPVRAVSVMVMCSIAIQGYSVWALRHAIQWRRLWPFVAGGVLTVPLGVGLLARTPSHAFAAGFGTFLIIYGAYLMCRRDPPVVRATSRSDAAAGALGGLAGGLAGFPGSVVTIWCGMRGWPKEHQRGVYQPYILMMQLEALVCLQVEAPAALGLETFTVYAPLALAAACAGFAIFRRMTNRQFNATVYLLLIASGLSLLAGLPVNL